MSQSEEYGIHKQLLYIKLVETFEYKIDNRTKNNCEFINFRRSIENKKLKGTELINYLNNIDNGLPSQWTLEKGLSELVELNSIKDIVDNILIMDYNYVNYIKSNPELYK